MLCYDSITKSALVLVQALVTVEVLAPVSVLVYDSISNRVSINGSMLDVSLSINVSVFSVNVLVTV